MTETTAPRAMFLGFDAMDPDIVDRLIADGQLPTLAGLSERSLRATTANPEGLVVGGCWPTIWSGTSPAVHGFYCFRQIVNGSYEVRRFTPNDIHVQPFWMSLADAGRSVALLDVPIVRQTTPAGGVHIVDLGTHDRMLAPSSFPPGLLDEVTLAHGPHPIIGRCDAYSRAGRWQDLVEDLEAAASWRADVSSDLLGRRDWDLFATVFSESHCAGHQFWWLHDERWPGHDPHLAATLGDPIARVYRAIDGALARIVEHATADTRVAVLMSHGIGAHYDGDHLFSEILRRLDDAAGARPGWLRARESAIRKGQRLTRSARGVVHADDPRFHRVSMVDGSRRVFAVPNNELFAGLRLNLVGREPRGRVRPGPDAEALTAWLTAELMGLTDPESGRSLVRRVLRVDDLFAGPRRDDLPDLLVDWERSAPISAASSPTIGVVRGRYGGIRTGDHRPEGRLLVSGPGVEPGDLDRRLESTEIAPMLCDWFGVTHAGEHTARDRASGGARAHR